MVDSLSGHRTLRCSLKIAVALVAEGYLRFQNSRITEIFTVKAVAGQGAQF
jgi:hypothetical protein